MKRKQVTLAVILAALSCLAAPSALAISEADVLTIKKAVATVPGAEISAKAAQLVAQAADKDRKEVALITVREVASKRPGAIIPVIGAIAKAAPEVSVSVAEEAVKLVDYLAPEIAKAAAAGAPAHADKIAAATAKMAPKSATKVTLYVASVVPDQALKVVETVVAMVPAAQTEISNEPSLARLTRRSAGNQGGSGIITSRPGTIGGGPVPPTPPTQVGPGAPGFDPNRYAEP